MDEEIDIEINEKKPNRFKGVGSFLISISPILLLLGFYSLNPKMRQMFGIGGSGQAFSREKSDIKFKDVAGIDEAKADLEEIIGFLKNPDRFKKVGAEIPKGVLLVGPPGTGKTLLAKAVAGEADVPFYAVAGSEFVELFVGMGAKRIRELFKKAKQDDPCIIFIDEIDALAKSRTLLSHDERDQTLNQFLTELDGFSSRKHGIIVIGATNRPEELDRAVTRPGRLGREVYVPTPDLNGRIEILHLYMKKIQEDKNIDIVAIAKGTSGFSGAELANLVNEAALRAGRENRELVTQEDFEKARDKIMMGAERKIEMSEKERTITAYHEAGHAIVGIHADGNDPLHKVSIIPRGRALGVTVNLPEEDRYHITKPELMAKLAMLYGGRAAEKIHLGTDRYTSGASGDIEQASNLARKMVAEWGMSELGAVRFAEPSNDDLGGSFQKSAAISEDTNKKIDAEVRKFIKNGEEEARKILEQNRNQLDVLVKALLERETLEAEQVYELFGMPMPANDTVQVETEPDTISHS